MNNFQMLKFRYYLKDPVEKNLIAIKRKMQYFYLIGPT